MAAVSSLQPRPPSREGEGAFFAFRAAHELAALLSRFGRRIQAVQLTAGPLQGGLQLMHWPGLTLLRLQVNQAVLLEGDRSPGVIAFSLELGDNLELHRVQGKQVQDQSLSGFSLALDTVSFQLSRGSNCVIALVEAPLLLQLLQRLGHDELEEKLHLHNSVVLPKAAFANVANYLSALLRGNVVPEQGGVSSLAFLMDQLTALQPQAYPSSTRSSREDLFQDLSRWALTHPSEPVNLEQLSAVLYASRRTVLQSCREATGLGPMEFLRNVRLEQVRRVLLDHDLQAELGVRGVQQVASYYGFHSRGHFAAAYSSLFAEAPSETLASGRRQLAVA